MSPFTFNAKFCAPLSCEDKAVPSTEPTNSDISEIHCQYNPNLKVESPAKPSQNEQINKASSSKDWSKIGRFLRLLKKNDLN